MKLIVVCMTLIACTMAQRPSYAGTGPIGRPSLANRFRDPNAETTTVNINNRVGEAAGSTERLPVDARGDGELVNRLNQWPREHRPFWLLNAEHIEAARNPSTNDNQIGNRNSFESSGTITAKPIPQRSGFLPPLNSDSS